MFPAHTRIFMLALLTACAVGLFGCERHREPQEVAPVRIGVLPDGTLKPNIIMILQDTLRADRLGVYGHTGGLTPTMDVIAAEGVTFDYCVAAAPWTVPSVASLFVSYYPGVHKANKYQVGKAEDNKQVIASQSVLSDEFHTLAELLQADGYQTAGFSANKLLWKPSGISQGFEHFDTSFAGNTVRGELVNQAALEWLAGQRDPDKPLFLYLHYMDVHGPYDADPRFLDPLMERVETLPGKHRLNEDEWAALARYLKKPPVKTNVPQRYHRLKHFREYWVARYEAGVAEADFYIGQLVEELRERGLWDAAYVILLADHGEALCEHGWWDHGRSQHQTDLHVPLILRWPGVLPAGRHVRRLAGLIDVLPTVSEQLRLSPADDWQGTSLVNDLVGKKPESARIRFAEASQFRMQYALFREFTKLIVTRPKDSELAENAPISTDMPTLLFDLSMGHGETINLATRQTETIVELGQLMNEVIQSNHTLKPDIVQQEMPVKDDIMEKLKTLGYLGREDDDEEEP